MQSQMLRMLKLCVASLSLAVISSSLAFLFSQNKWDGLSVTFGVNPFDPNVFSSLPRQESAAISAGWTKISDCDANGKFRGVRYVLKGDYAVVLLFDVNGYIAGIQSGIAKAGLPSYYPPEKQKGRMFQEDGDHYYLTAYFTPPADICGSGRSHSSFHSDGTGTGLFIQNGSVPEQAYQIPSSQSGMANSPWSLGHCFPAMGVHYWYSLTTDMDCDDFQPIFILYNEQRLTAFGWAMGAMENSPRFEHPTQSVLASFLNPVPKCLNNYAALSTMHIYMTAHPTRDLC